jgi:hypothetical protein
MSYFRSRHACEDVLWAMLPFAGRELEWAAVLPETSQSVPGAAGRGRPVLFRMIR